MLLQRPQFRDAYEAIKAAAPDSACRVLILCALDPDAVCACKMLSLLLKADFIAHKVHPIAGWQDLARANETLVKNIELSFIILLNFGSFFDPLQYLSVDSGVTIHVIDSHRPIMLESCYFEGNVVVWDDGEMERNTEIAEAFRDWHAEQEQLGVHQTEDSSEAESEDSEEEESRSERGSDGARKRRSRGSETDDDEELDGGVFREGLRRKTDDAAHILSPRESERARRRRQRQNGAVLAEYYDQGDWLGESVACLVYSLATELGREDKNLLWMAIVGLTSLSIAGHLTSEDYSLYFNNYRDEVSRLNTSSRNVSASDSSIRTEDEFRFMLFRHWSLEDSMVHSPYLSSKMKMYSEQGRRQLHKLFAKMGFSLQQCRQIYTHMDMDLKQALREKLTRFAPGYGLDDMIIRTFVRRYGYRCQLSASDVSYALQALLEAGANADAVSGIGEQTDRLRGENDLLSNFYCAYDALDDIELLLRAIPLSMSLQRAVVRTGTALIDKREIRSLRSFRMAVVKEGPDLSLFSHPLALGKLAGWISGAVDELERERGKKRHLPFVVAALDERRDRYLVLGTAVTPSSRDVIDATDLTRKRPPRNRFGNAFQQLSGNQQARFRLDSFNASVVECDKADLGQLLETLSLQALS
ncbi:DNA replication initiation factor cdc45 [Savitreella phatthalungensis]